MSKEHPILFSTPMVQALLDGRKTMTRRILKPQPDENGIDFMPAPPSLDWEQHYKTNWTCYLWDTEEGERISMNCPYGNVGDILWVREATGEDVVSGKILYKADTGKYPFVKRWKPSIHMKKKDCRIRLEITNIRVERLQDITEDDCFKEGTIPGIMIYKPNVNYKIWFSQLWASIHGNGEHSWEANPWVWVLSFKKL